MEEKLLIEQEIAKFKSNYQDITLTTLNICEIIELVSKRRILIDFSKYVEKDFDYNGLHFPNETYIDRYLKLETYAIKQQQNIENIYGMWNISDEEFNKIIVNNKNKPELKVKCLHCGRKFIGKMPHKCNTGYRKRNHKWEEL